MNFPNIFSVRCNGSEETFFDCQLSDDVNCGRYQDASVICRGITNLVYHYHYCVNNVIQITNFVSKILHIDWHQEILQINLLTVTVLMVI